MNSDQFETGIPVSYTHLRLLLLADVEHVFQRQGFKEKLGGGIVVREMCIRDRGR